MYDILYSNNMMNASLLQVILCVGEKLGILGGFVGGFKGR